MQEGFQAWQDTPQETGRDLGIVEQLVQAEAKASFHEGLLSTGSFCREELYANDLRLIRLKTQ